MLRNPYSILFRSVFWAVFVHWLTIAPAVTAQDVITFTAEQVAKGETLYQTTCQICHGNRLSNGQFGTPLRGSYFRNTWKGKTLGELVQHTWEKMPPDNVQSLTWEQVTEVLSFILSRNDVVPGESPMSTDMEVLLAIPLPWQ
jgi:mono/diheme cytochrome c family protein